MALNIPEGYELLGGRSREHAIEAIKRATDRGLESASVLTNSEGYLIPLGDDATAEVEELDVVTEKNTVEEIDAFAAEWDIDLAGTKTKADKIKAIEAEIEARTAAQENEDLDAKNEGRTPVLLDTTNKED